MTPQEPESKTARRIGLVAAAVALSIGIVVLLGWLFHVESMVGIFLNLPPMPPATAVCITVLASTLFIYDNEKHYRLVLALPAIVAAICLLTLCERLFRIDIGIQALIFDPIMREFPGQWGKMSLNGAMALFLLAVATGALAARTKTYIVTTVIGLGGGSVAMIALLGHLSEIDQGLGWYHRSSMTVISGVACCLLATSLMAEVFRHTTNPMYRRTLWGVISCCLIGITLSGFLWVAAINEDSKAIHARIDFDSQMRVRLIEQEIVTSTDLLYSAERFFSSSKEVDSEEFASFVAPLMTRIPV